MDSTQPQIAPIQELRDQLLVKQEAAADIAEKALSGIDSVIGVANFYLTLVAAFIAVIAFVGGVALVYIANRSAQKIASKGIQSYIDNPEMDDRIKRAISDEVARQIKERTFVMVSPQATPASVRGAFPERDYEGGRAE